MCSPELWRGLCCICCGKLESNNTLFEDLGDGRGGVHRGKCAYQAGIVAPEHQAAHDELIAVIHACHSGTVAHMQALKAYYMWLESLDLEDFDIFTDAEM